MATWEKLKAWALTCFRPAKPAHAGVIYAKTLLHTIIFWIVFLGVIPLSLKWAESKAGWPPMRWAVGRWEPWLGFALCGALGIGSSLVMVIRGRGTPLPFECASRMVIEGPYRFVRNPMAIAGLGQAAFVGLAIGSWLTLPYTLAGGIIWNYLVRPIEEEDLRCRFGQQFTHYADHVRCWLPRIMPYRPDD